MNANVRGSLKRKISDAVEEVNDSAGGKKYRCLADIDAERKCVYEQKNFNPGNFKRHFISCHAEVAHRLNLVSEGSDQPQNTKKRPKSASKVQVETTRSNVLLGTLQMITENNLSIRFPEWEGVQLLLGPLWNACDLKISRNTLPTLIHRAADIMRHTMAGKFYQKPICLKVDAATRHSKSIFGINLTFTDDDGIVQIMHLAAHEMPERQTQENLQRVIMDEIKVFGIEYSQIVAITSDNGQNILAAVRYMKRLLGDTLEGSLGSILRKEYSLVANSCDSENIETPELTETFVRDEEDILECELQMVPENDDFVEDLSRTEYDDELCEDGEDDKMINIDILESVRCGAHTAQLAVWDVLREYKTRLSNINKKCLRMHKKANRQMFMFHKTALPPKVCETRWNIWYILLRYLKELEGTPFLALLQTNDPDIDFSRQWSFINKFCDAFEPLFYLTLRSQKDHVPVSQFYADWLLCQAQLNAVNQSQNNVLARKLLVAMDKRSKILRTSMPFKACLYIDPRFNFLGSNRLSADEKIEIQKYLMSFNIRLNDLAGLNEEKCSDRNDEKTSDDFVEEYLTNLFQEETVTLSPSTNSSDSFITEIIKLETRPKVPITAFSAKEVTNALALPSTSAHSPTSDYFDIFKYWKQRKVSNPRLYRIAMALLSIPSTQIQERGLGTK
ncbi:uncharacterized protein LOC131681073 [Topomyia yanbarensis]|uniref:uncharacterized protein LOC131681073 n=1 Tax=Topomyia yanbarensis TaxID=2498891 RepID=UPI00273B85AE|nr:uncharacterized protein LOC131681073 [Topomyia yanbarensis]